MRRILFALVALAGLSLPAFAQSFDETVSYIQDRCVGHTVEYPMGSRTLSSTLLAFNAEEAGSIELTRMSNEGNRREYSVSMFDVVGISNYRNEIIIETRPDSARGRLIGGNRTNSVTDIYFFCPNPDRAVRAMEHLVSFAGDDPFAN